MRKIHTTLPSLKVKKYALLTVLGCGSQMGYGQVSKGQFENMGGLNDYGLYHVSSLAAVLTDFPQLPDVMGILGMLVLLLGSGYKMYRYKVALKEAQKANASLLRICNILSSETQLPANQVRNRLHHLRADVHQEEEKEPVDLLFLKTHFSVPSDPQNGRMNLPKEELGSALLSHKNHKLGRADQKIIENFIRLMREHMGDENLTQDAMAGKLGLSRSLYYEKIKNLTR